MTSSTALASSAAGSNIVAGLRGRGASAGDGSPAGTGDLFAFDEVFSDAIAGVEAAELISEIAPADAVAVVEDPARRTDLASLLSTVASKQLPTEIGASGEQAASEAPPVTSAGTRLQAHLSTMQVMAQFEPANRMAADPTLAADLKQNATSAEALRGDDFLVPVAAVGDALSTERDTLVGPQREKSAIGAALGSNPKTSVLQPALAGANHEVATSPENMPLAQSGSEDIAAELQPITERIAVRPLAANAERGGRSDGEAAPATLIASATADVAHGQGGNAGADLRSDRDQGGTVPRAPVKVEVLRQETHFAPVVDHAVAQQIADQTAQAIAGGQNGPSKPESRAAGTTQGVFLPTTVRTMEGGAVRVMHFQLQPADLGTVTVRMSMKDDALELQVEAALDQTARVIREDREILSKMLGAHGIKVDGLTVTVAEADRSQGGGFSGQSGQNGSPSFQSPGQSQSGSQSSTRDQSGSRFSGQDQAGRDGRNADRSGTSALSSIGGDIFV